MSTIDVLKTLLANTYTIFLMTQNYHWNVKGINFFELHKLFQEQYEEMFAAIDEIAERIAGLEEYVPGSFEEFAGLTQIEIDNKIADPRSMVANLKNAHYKLIKSIEEGLDIAGESGDEDTFDLLVQRLKAHNKIHWMLSKILQ